MNPKSHLKDALIAGLILLLSSLCANAAPVIWTGPTITFTQVAFDPTQATNQDRLTDHVWLTRAQTSGLFNAATETFFTHDLSPADTEWADGSASDYASLSFTNWDVWVKGVHFGPPSTIGVPAVVHLISEDIYVDIMFTSFGGSAGGFSYDRSTPASTVIAPSVTITNPADGTVLAAPANVSAAADASVAGGTVTNVEFFLNDNSIGSAQAAPFAVLANNLAPAAYRLTAVATAGGSSATSSVVNITVVAPVTVSNSTPVVANGQFSFDYSANPGLSYVVQKSANLLDWIPIATNTAATNPQHFTDTFVPGSTLFYRVGRLPNP
jgi:hypothetical protein